MSYFFAIFKNETDEDHQDWIKACENSVHGIKYEVIDITKYDWIEKVQTGDFDYFLTRPSANISFFKQLYDERLYILYNILQKKIYPSYEEILIYENKRFLSYWLKANNIPHPRTWIFYYKDEAYEFIKKCPLPIVAKTSIGAAGSGVMILQEKKSLEKYIDRAFSHKGIVRKWGPNIRKGDIGKRFLNRIKKAPSAIKYFKNKYVSSHIDPQRMFLILQEYIKCDFEWRAVRIGNSYFAHKKLRRFGKMMSGTSSISWDGPPEQLLNFVKDVCDKRSFLSQAVDIFEDKNGQYLVNEMQCFFGSKNPHQMVLNGKPGRYVHRDSQWIFEEGSFNSNNSYDLRLDHVIRLLNKNEL